MNDQIFITKYRFQRDEKKRDRILESVQVGGVHISRLIVRGFGMIANLYYRTTNFIFFVETGRMKVKFIQVNTKEEKEFLFEPGDGIIHVPPFVAFAMRNADKTKAVITVFSDKTLRSDDDVPYEVYPKK